MSVTVRWGERAEEKEMQWRSCFADVVGVEVKDTIHRATSDAPECPSGPHKSLRLHFSSPRSRRRKNLCYA